MESFLWILSTAMMLALLGLLALRAFDELLGVRSPRLAAGRATPPRSRPAVGRRSPAAWPWPAQFAAPLIILWLGAFCAYAAVTGSTAGFLSHFWARFTGTGDASFYLHIAEHGYVPDGEYAKAIVFYPLYPLLTGGLGALLGGRTALAGMILSQVCYGLSSVVMAALARKECAYPGLALTVYWLYPFGFFCLGVFTEGLFLLLTLLGLYLLRERRWLAAGLTGFLCALTRIQGILLLLPGVYLAWQDAREHGWDRRYPALLGPLLGFGAYLLVNRVVCGSFFAFHGYETAPPWYQSVQWVGDTVVQQLDLAREYPGLSRWIYWPQLTLYFIGALLLMAGYRRGLGTGYILIGAAYLGMCYTVGWLISGGRYMLGCVSLYLCVGRLKCPVLRYLLPAAELAAFAAMYVWFMQGQAIM